MLRYEGIVPGRFCQRVNRFTAWVELAEGRTLCHVKNTGRCAELLRPGAPVWCQHSDAPGRKTAYTLITVARDGAYFNLDSTAPNALAAQWLASGGAGFLPEQLRREVSWEDSRFDLAYVLFVAAMEHVVCVRPNEQNDPAFARALVEAQQAGVTLLALRCKVEPDAITPLAQIPVCLDAL